MNEFSRKLKLSNKYNEDDANVNICDLYRDKIINNSTDHKKNISKFINPITSFSDSLNYLKLDWRNIIKEPHWGANLSSALTVAAVALPLNIALAIAAGLPATTGLIAGAIGGAFAALFGGSRFQATGPAAALNAIVFTMVQQFGPVGAAAGALLVGIIQLLLSAGSAGNLMKWVPESVLIGFTTGVGIKLLDSQIPKLFGIDWSLYSMLRDWHNPLWLHETSWTAVVCGLTVIILIMSFRTLPKFPAALVGIFITTQLAIFLNWPIHRVGDVPALELILKFPELSLNSWLQLIQIAIPLGLLAAAESLLSAQAIDRMSGDNHHPNLEIFGQGIANIATGLFGGMTVSGVVVRSTVNVQSGAKNRLSSFFHAMILLGSTLFLGGILSKVPIASLAGLLCIIGFRLIEFKEFTHYLHSNKWHALAFLTAAIGTITNYLVSGLTLGLLISFISYWLEKDQSQSKQNDILKPRKISNDEIENAILNETQNKTIIYQVLERGERWIQHLKEHASVPNTSFVHPQATVIGRVVLGKNVHIAAEASVRADEGTPFYIGDDTNVQDGVVIHALKQKWVTVRHQKWAVYIGSNVSMAHQALIHGPCFIGDNTFIGFKAIVHDSIIGSGCYIGIGAIVVGVEIGDEKYVPHGALIDSKEKAQALSRVSSSHQKFNEDVVEVNKGLAEAYREIHKVKENETWTQI